MTAELPSPPSLLQISLKQIPRDSNKQHDVSKSPWNVEDSRLRNDLDCLFEKGKKLEEVGDYDSALQAFLTCLAIDSKRQLGFPNLPNALHQIGEIYSKKGLYPQALKFLEAEKYIYEQMMLVNVSSQEPLTPLKSSSPNIGLPRQYSWNGSGSRGPGSFQDQPSTGHNSAYQSTHGTAGTDASVQGCQIAVGSVASHGMPSRTPSFGASSLTSTEVAARMEQRADAYDRMSSMFLEEKRFDLAWEYAQKGLRIREEMQSAGASLRESWENKIEALAKVYFEIGRHKYSEALDRYRRAKSTHTDHQGEPTTSRRGSLGRPNTIRDPAFDLLSPSSSSTQTTLGPVDPIPSPHHPPRTVLLDGVTASTVMRRRRQHTSPSAHAAPPHHVGQWPDPEEEDIDPEVEAASSEYGEYPGNSDGNSGECSLSDTARSTGPSPEAGPANRDRSQSSRSPLARDSKRRSGSKRREGGVAKTSWADQDGRERPLLNGFVRWTIVVIVVGTFVAVVVTFVTTKTWRLQPV